MGSRPTGEMMERSESAHALASALRELKSRQGRSFEALAKRLATSKSALHRYTSGEVVPARFSIVELWARECGASATEIAELRRLWLNATAEQQSDAAPADDVPLEAPRPSRRRWLTPAVFLAMGGVTAAVVVALARDGQASDLLASRPSSAASEAGAAPGSCEARAGVRHVDARRSGHVWRTDYVCPNVAGVALYDEPGGSRKIAVMETEQSWFTCWTTPPGSSAVWYYTRGDRSEPGTEAWDGWGFVPAEAVVLPTHPAPSMPECWFAPALSSSGPPAR
ncbi:helix-turn-helix transcriptional regulator [Actinoplanes sp. NPDC049548]|uniref:helix-turn-helix domain-containing protein n=1 Tax=Actinoplanes sp. NPDC049548 TaxID=3155152 RepID=UPI00343655B9